jgi:phenylpropionate dioxygenase-like ring-hydroxylating dioxygenase large terminal subunit
MLRNAPHVVGWAGEVAAPGAYTTKDVMGVPVLIVRGKDGIIRAFVNGCAHRGAQVACGCGMTNMFTCPYHGWTYRTDGRLAGAPARKMFSDALDGRGLTPLPVSEQAGLITVGLTQAADLDDVFEEMAEPLSHYDFSTRHHAETRRFEIATNWKLAVDVNFEGYHFPYVHADTLDPSLPTTRYATFTVGTTVGRSPSATSSTSATLRNPTGRTSSLAQSSTGCSRRVSSSRHPRPIRCFGCIQAAAQGRASST